jgi:hypothetical protein
MEEDKSLKSNKLTLSPTIKKRRANIALDIEKERFDNEYSSCCSRSGKTDARLIRYASRFSISLILLTFACVQITRAGDCDPLVPFYTSLITLVMGAWVKTDNIKTEKK